NDGFVLGGGLGCSRVVCGAISRRAGVRTCCTGVSGRYVVRSQEASACSRCYSTARGQRIGIRLAVDLAVVVRCPGGRTLVDLELDSRGESEVVVRTEGERPLYDLVEADVGARIAVKGPAEAISSNQRAAGH